MATPGRGAAWTSAGAVDLADRRLVHLTHETILLDYAGTKSPVYVGWALPGSATSDDAWRIAKITYNGDGNPISLMWAESSIANAFEWDDRATFTYG